MNGIFYGCESIGKHLSTLTRAFRQAQCAIEFMSSFL